MKHISLVLIFILLTISCRKEKTQWNSDYVVPLINDSLSLQNYVNDSTLSVNAGNYQVALKRKLFNFDINSEVEIPDTVITNSYSSIVTVGVPPGYEFVNNAQEQQFDLDNLELTTVYLEKGEIKVQVFNPFPTKVICKINLPTTKKNGVAITDELTIDAGSSANPTIGTKTIDIAYATMDLKGLNGNVFNTLPYQLTIKSDPNGPTVTNSPSTVINVETKLQNIELFYAKGYFGTRVISDTIETDIEELNYWTNGTVDLPGIDLNLKLSNTIKAMGRINLKEVSTTKNGVTTQLSSNQINVAHNINQASGSWTTLTAATLDYAFNSNNSNLEQFLENAGAKMKIVYEFELNPLGNITSSNNELFPESKVELDLALNMPLSIGLDNFTLQDTLKLDLSKNEVQLDKAQEATLIVEAQNGFPIQGKLALILLDEFNQPLLSIGGNEVIASGLTGFPNSYGVNVKESKLTWKLSKTDIELLKKSKHIIVVGKLDTPDPNTTSSIMVNIQEASFIATKAYLNLIYKNEL